MAWSFKDQYKPVPCPWQKCTNSSAASKKVYPYCTTVHKRLDARKQKRDAFMSFMKTRAKAGQPVDNSGAVCEVKSITTMTTTTGVAGEPGTEWIATFTTWCGQSVDTPVRAEVETLTCLMCLAEKGT